MIVFEGVSKVLRTRFGQSRSIMASVDLRIPSNRRIAMFSSSPEDTPILINLLAGVTLPTAGRIRRFARVSFPVGYQGGFDQQLSVRHNVAHVARMYGNDVSSTVEFVREVSGLRDAFDKPFGHLPARDKNHLGWLVAYSIPFDLYLHATDVTNPGVASQFGERMLALIEARGRHAGMIVAARSLKNARAICDMGLVFHRGRLVLLDDIDTLTFADLQTRLAAVFEDAPPNVPTLRRMFGPEV